MSSTILRCKYCINYSFRNAQQHKQHMITKHGTGGKIQPNSTATGSKPASNQMDRSNDGTTAKPRRQRDTLGVRSDEDADVSSTTTDGDLILGRACSVGKQLVQESECSSSSSRSESSTASHPVVSSKSSKRLNSKRFCKDIESTKSRAETGDRQDKDFTSVSFPRYSNRLKSAATTVSSNAESTTSAAGRRFQVKNSARSKKMLRRSSSGISVVSDILYNSSSTTATNDEGAVSSSTQVLTKESIAKMVSVTHGTRTKYDKHETLENVKANPHPQESWKDYYKFVAERRGIKYQASCDDTGRRSYVCQICGNNSLQLTHAVNHHRVHTGSKPYQCLLCKYKSRQQNAMKSHLSRVHKDMISSPCALKSKCTDGGDYILTFKRNRDNGTKNVSNTTYKCPRFQRKLSGHVRKPPNLRKTYVCSHCSYTSLYSWVMKKHLITSHNIRKPQMGEGDGSESVNDVDDELLVANVIKKTWKKMNVQRVTKIKDLTSKHQDDSKRTNIDSWSKSRAKRSKMEDDAVSLEDDVWAAKSSPNTASGQSEYGYRRMLRSIRSGRYLRKGISFCSIDAEESMEGDIRMSGRLQCPQCGKSFDNCERTLEHIREHTGYQPYSCDFCGFTTGIGSDVTMHIGQQRIDRGKLKQLYTLKVGQLERTADIKMIAKSELYKCPCCPRTFESVQYAKQHYRIHTNEKPYRCNLCSSYNTVSQSQMSDHIKLYHRKCVVICPTKKDHGTMEYCSLSTEEVRDRSQRKKRSIRKRYMQESSDFTDSQGESQNESGNSSTETLTSTSQHFVTDSTLRLRHQWHTVLIGSVERSLQPKVKRDAKKHQGQFCCPFCCKLFDELDMAMVHVRFHSGERPYRCIACEYVTAYEDKILLHGELHEKYGVELPGNQNDSTTSTHNTVSGMELPEQAEIMDDMCHSQRDIDDAQLEIQMSGTKGAECDMKDTLNHMEDTVNLMEITACDREDTVCDREDTVYAACARGDISVDFDKDVITANSNTKDAECDVEDTVNHMEDTVCDREGIVCDREDTVYAACARGDISVDFDKDVLSANSNTKDAECDVEDTVNHMEDTVCDREGIVCDREDTVYAVSDRGGVSVDCDEEDALSADSNTKDGECDVKDTVCDREDTDCNEKDRNDTDTAVPDMEDTSSYCNSDYTDTACVMADTVDDSEDTMSVDSDTNDVCSKVDTNPTEYDKQGMLLDSDREDNPSATDSDYMDAKCVMEDTVYDREDTVYESEATVSAHFDTKDDVCSKVDTYPTGCDRQDISLDRDREDTLSATDSNYKDAKCVMKDIVYDREDTIYDSEDTVSAHFNTKDDVCDKDDTKPSECDKQDMSLDCDREDTLSVTDSDYMDAKCVMEDTVYDREDTVYESEGTMSAHFDTKGDVCDKDHTKPSERDKQDMSLECDREDTLSVTDSDYVDAECDIEDTLCDTEDTVYDRKVSISPEFNRDYPLSTSLHSKKCDDSITVAARCDNEDSEPSDLYTSKHMNSDSDATMSAAESDYEHTLLAKSDGTHKDTRSDNLVNITADNRSYSSRVDEDNVNCKGIDFVTLKQCSNNSEGIHAEQLSMSLKMHDLMCKPTCQRVNDDDEELPKNQVSDGECVEGDISNAQISVPYDINANRASTVIQSYIRGFLVRRHLKKMHAAASCLQRRFRSNRVFKQYRIDKLSARDLQLVKRASILTTMRNGKNCLSNSIAKPDCSALLGVKSWNEYPVKTVVTHGTEVLCYVENFLHHKCKLPHTKKAVHSLEIDNRSSVNAIQEGQNKLSPTKKTGLVTSPTTLEPINIKACQQLQGLIADHHASTSPLKDKVAVHNKDIDNSYGVNEIQEGQDKLITPKKKTGLVTSPTVLESSNLQACQQLQGLIAYHQASTSPLKDKVAVHNKDIDKRSDVSELRGIQDKLTPKKKTGLGTSPTVLESSNLQACQQLQGLIADHNADVERSLPIKASNQELIVVEDLKQKQDENTLLKGHAFLDIRGVIVDHQESTSPITDNDNGATMENGLEQGHGSTLCRTDSALPLNRPALRHLEGFLSRLTNKGAVPKPKARACGKEDDNNESEVNVVSTTSHHKCKQPNTALSLDGQACQRLKDVLIDLVNKGSTSNASSQFNMSSIKHQPNSMHCVTAARKVESDVSSPAASVSSTDQGAMPETFLENGCKITKLPITRLTPAPVKCVDLQKECNSPSLHLNRQACSRLTGKIRGLMNKSFNHQAHHIDNVTCGTTRSDSEAHHIDDAISFKLQTQYFVDAISSKPKAHHDDDATQTQHIDNAISFNPQPHVDNLNLDLQQDCSSPSLPMNRHACSRLAGKIRGLMNKKTSFNTEAHHVDNVTCGAMRSEAHHNDDAISFKPETQHIGDAIYSAKRSDIDQVQAEHTNPIISSSTCIGVPNLSSCTTHNVSQTKSNNSDSCSTLNVMPAMSGPEDIPTVATNKECVDQYSTQTVPPKQICTLPIDVTYCKENVPCADFPTSEVWQNVSTRESEAQVGRGSSSFSTKESAPVKDATTVVLKESWPAIRTPTKAHHKSRFCPKERTGNDQYSIQTVPPKEICTLPIVSPTQSAILATNCKILSKEHAPCTDRPTWEVLQSVSSRKGKEQAGNGSSSLSAKESTPVKGATMLVLKESWPARRNSKKSRRKSQFWPKPSTSKTTKLNSVTGQHCLWPAGRHVHDMSPRNVFLLPASKRPTLYASPDRNAIIPETGRLWQSPARWSNLKMSRSQLAVPTPKNMLQNTTSETARFKITNTLPKKLASIPDLSSEKSANIPETSGHLTINVSPKKGTHIPQPVASPHNLTSEKMVATCQMSGHDIVNESTITMSTNITETASPPKVMSQKLKSPTKVEPSKEEPPKMMPAKLEPPKVAPQIITPPKVATSKDDPLKMDHPKIDPLKVMSPKVVPPKVASPKVTPPEVALPEVTPPKSMPANMESQKFEPQKVNPPKVEPPKLTPPKVTPLKVTPPKVEPPRAAPTKVTHLKLTPTKLVPPKDTPPEVTPPKVMPQLKPPKVTPPKQFGQWPSSYQYTTVNVSPIENVCKAEPSISHPKVIPKQIVAIPQTDQHKTITISPKRGTDLIQPTNVSQKNSAYITKPAFPDPERSPQEDSTVHKVMRHNSCNVSTEKDANKTELVSEPSQKLDPKMDATMQATTSHKITIKPSPIKANIKPTPNKTSIELYLKGNIESFPEKGNIELSPELGNIEPSPKMGNIEPSSKTGNIEPSPMTGNIGPSTNKASYEPSPKKGTIEAFPKNGNIEQSPKKGNIKPSPTNTNIKPSSEKSNTRSSPKKGNVEPSPKRAKIELFPFPKKSNNIPPQQAMNLSPRADYLHLHRSRMQNYYRDQRLTDPNVHWSQYSYCHSVPREGRFQAHPYNGPGHTQQYTGYRACPQPSDVRPYQGIPYPGLQYPQAYPGHQLHRGAAFPRFHPYARNEGRTPRY